MSKLKLPIDLIKSARGTSGQLRFKWRMKTNSIPGKTSMTCEGSLPPSVEDAVASLIIMVKQKEQVIEVLYREVKALKEERDSIKLQIINQVPQDTDSQTTHKRNRK